MTRINDIKYEIDTSFYFDESKIKDADYCFRRYSAMRNFVTGVLLTVSLMKPDVLDIIKKLREEQYERKL